VKDAFSSSGPETGKGKTKLSGKRVKHGYHLVKGKSNHPMEDYLVAEYRQVGEHDLGLFAIFDGHLGHTVSDFLRSHLFNNILSEVMFHFSYSFLSLQTNISGSFVLAFAIYSNDVRVYMVASCL